MIKNKKATMGGVADGDAREQFYSPKVFPPYGKRLDDIRRSGLIPDNRIIVSTDWKIGKAYPRIVIEKNMNISELRFEYLAGLNVQITYFEHDANILPDLIEALMQVKPATLTTFNMSAAKSGKPAFKLIHTKVNGG